MNKIKQYTRLMLGALLVVLSLALIFVVGYAQALKSYQQQSRDAVLAQTEVARMGIEQILSSGVPLQDIAGLEKIYQLLDELEPVSKDEEVFRPVIELYRWPMAAAF